MPVFFAVSGINFPIGVLLYWFTTNVWSMGQQFYVIRRMPAPGSAAEQAYEERQKKRGKTIKKLHIPGLGDTTTDQPDVQDILTEAPKSGQRQQPKGKKRSKRGPSGGPGDGAAASGAAAGSASTNGSGSGSGSSTPQDAPSDAPSNGSGATGSDSVLVRVRVRRAAQHDRLASASSPSARSRSQAPRARSSPKVRSSGSRTRRRPGVRTRVRRVPTRPDQHDGYARPDEPTSRPSRRIVPTHQ